MSLYSIAADLLEFTDRTERSRSVHAQTARASAARDSPRREPRTRRDLEPPKLCSSEENPTEQAPTLDILADCLDHIHQVQRRMLMYFLGGVIGIQYLRDDRVLKFQAFTVLGGASLSYIASFTT